MDIITYSKLKKCISVDINAGHSFATTTDRDTFFTTNPTQLKANMYIYCNGQLQQYINSAWEVKSTAIQGNKGDTGITPHIDSTTNNWFIDTVDTGILAEGTDGLTPHIDETTNNWFIGTTDTGIKAVGTNGITPHIGLNGNWYVGETDTLVKAQGVNGTDGIGIQSVVDNNDNTFTITLSDDTTVIIDKIDTINSDVITQGTTKLLMTTAERTKLTSVENGAEVNNISDTNVTDLTDNGDTTLHYHSSDRDRTNHTGVQAISTVTGLQTALDSKTNKDFTTYTQKADVANDDKIAINDSADSNSVKYVTLNQLVSSVQDPHNKGYYATGTALNTAIPTATNGDFAVVGATNTIWVWNGTAFVDSSASGAVLSINGETGIVTLTKNHIGLNNVVNFDTSTTANITDSTDKRFVTDANLVVIGNTSGTNTGDETQSTITTKIGFTPLSKTLADTYYEPKDSAIQTHIVSTSNPHSVTKNQVGLGNCDNTSDLNKPVSTATKTALDLKADKTTTYSKTEVDNAISAVITSLDWKESVATYTDIATTYPTPEDGWTVTVKDTDETYRYNGTEWVSILTSTIPLASDTVDGKMSSTDFTKLSNITGTNTGDETNTTIKTKLGTDLSNKVDKVIGKSLISDTEITRLSTVVNYDDSNIVKKTGNETIAGIKTFSDNLIVKGIQTTNGVVSSNFSQGDLPSGNSTVMCYNVSSGKGRFICVNKDAGTGTLTYLPVGFGGFHDGKEDLSFSADGTPDMSTPTLNGMKTLLGLSSKLEVTNLIQGDNITLTKVGNDVTIASSGGGSSGVIIENNLTSTSTTNGLSANQGKVLNDNKQGKTIIVTDLSSTLKTQLLADNTEYRFGTLTSLTITYPSDFACSLSFSSGSTATTLTISNVKFWGMDCSNGVFTPLVNKRYNLIFWFDGINVNCTTGGV